MNIKEGEEYDDKPKSLTTSLWRNLVISANGEVDETIYRKYCSDDIATAKLFGDGEVHSM